MSLGGWEGCAETAEKCMCNRNFEECFDEKRDYNMPRVGATCPAPYEGFTT
jgi:hypothetical protein